MRGILLDYDQETAAVDVPELLANFDHTCPAYNRSSIAFMQQVHKKGCPVMHTDSNDGFYLVSDYELISVVARHPEVFSNEQGITIPVASIGRTLPIDVDPPLSLHYRALLAPYLSPTAVKARAPEIRALARELVEAKRSDGQLDVVLDLAQPLTGRTTMRILGLPEEEWHDYAGPIHDATFGNGEPAELYGRIMAFNEAIKQDVTEPGRAKSGGAIDNLRKATVDGRPVTLDEVMAIIRLILVGGLDTAQAAVGTASVYLEQHPDQRQLLIDQPQLMDGAILELLRVLAPQQMLCRTLKSDFVLGEQPLKAGDRVMLLWAAGNYDPVMFPDPEKVDFRRKTTRHLTFGKGAHRCAGSYLAELEINASLSELLRFAPNYRVKTDLLQLAPRVGVVYGYNFVPIEF